MKTLTTTLIAFAFLAGCDTSDRPLRAERGVFIQSIMEAVCARAVACTIIPAGNEAGCIDGLLETECEEQPCDELIEVRREELDGCISDYGVFSCSLVQLGDMPPRCSRLL